MALPDPTFSFSIPSLYDGVRLECRLYHPSRQQDLKSTRENKGTIIAHPYAPLGGCFDDPTVSAAGNELLQAGWVVGTFNLRGAGKSGGRTSWTGKPELADYVSFYGFMMHYLHQLEANGPSKLPDECHDGGHETEDGPRPKLLLSGYSYGSMLTSYLPSPETILDIFTSFRDIQWVQEIILTAAQLYKLWIRDPYKSPPVRPVVHPSVSYLLISPILPPVTFFTAITLFAPHRTLDVVIQGKHIKSSKPAENLVNHKSLAIYGDDDVFTSVKKLRKWCAELTGEPHSQFQRREVNGAGHFWLDEDAILQLRSLIREWISTI
ncbi:hypothetical protein VTO42DRAFT_4955 [Malbranchea cinnamomea]